MIFFLNFLQIVLNKKINMASTVEIQSLIRNLPSELTVTSSAKKSTANFSTENDFQKTKPRLRRKRAKTTKVLSQNHHPPLEVDSFCESERDADFEGDNSQNVTLTNDETSEKQNHCCGNFNAQYSMENCQDDGINSGTC